jgi:hypothetical protein
MCHSSVLRQTLTARLDASHKLRQTLTARLDVSHNGQPDLKTAAVTTRLHCPKSRQSQRPERQYRCIVLAQPCCPGYSPHVTQITTDSRPESGKKSLAVWMHAHTPLSRKQRCNLPNVHVALGLSEHTANGQTADCSATWHVAKINPSRMLGSAEHVTKVHDRRLIGSSTKASRFRQTRYRS